jgi:hypothetical protein
MKTENAGLYGRMRKRILMTAAGLFMRLGDFCRAKARKFRVMSGEPETDFLSFELNDLENDPESEFSAMDDCMSLELDDPDPEPGSKLSETD